MTIAVADEIVDAEIVPTADEARASIDRARTHAQGFWAEVKWQVENSAWEALGYESLDQMWDAEYMALNVGIARSDRPELVASFRKAGQTQAEIAAKLNVSQKTVSNDLAKPLSNFTKADPDAPANVNTDTGEIESEQEAPEKPKRDRAREKAEREASIVNDLRLYLRHIGTDKTITGMTPNAKRFVIEALEEAATNLKESM